MKIRRIMLPAVLALVAVGALATPSLAASSASDAFFNSVIPSRVDHLIGFTPTTFAIHPRGQRVVPIKVRVGGRTLPLRLRQRRRGRRARRPTSTCGT